MMHLLIGYLQPAGSGALETTFRLKVFDKFTAIDETRTAKQLAYETGAQPELIGETTHITNCCCSLGNCALTSSLSC